MTTIQIPQSPTYPNITLPQAPTLNTPTLSIDAVTEPAINDPTGSLQAFVYERYASVINSLLDGKIEELLTWAGDDVLFKAQTAKAQDEIMGELLAVHNKILSSSAARGFRFMPGEAKNDVVVADLGARRQLQAAGVQAQAELADTALQFVSWAADAGMNQVRVGVDENKSIVYANMSAVDEVISSLSGLRQQQIEVFDGKVKLYGDALAGVDTQLLEQGAQLSHYETGVAKARMIIKKDETVLDEQHAKNLGISIGNAEQLVQAEQYLQEAGLEKQKVLQTHAILSGFIAQIKEAHAGLVEDRANVSTTIAEKDLYKKEAQLVEAKAQEVLTEISGARDTLGQYYKLAMARIKQSRAELSATEAGHESTKDSARITSEGYRRQLRETLVLADNRDIVTLAKNNAKISEWIGRVEKGLSAKIVQSEANRKANDILMKGTYEEAREIVKGCAEHSRADWLSKAATTLDLTHNIS